MGQQPPRISHPPATPAEQRRVENRRRLREFLRATPRAEAESRLELLMPPEEADAVEVTRGWLTEAIERLRPEVRQVIRLTLERRWTQKKARAYLHGISARTLERDQNAGLDALIDQATGL